MKRSKVFAAVIAVTVITVLGISIAARGGKAVGSGEVNVFPLTKGELVSTLSASGSIGSDKNYKVYTGLGLPVVNYYAEVGSLVKKDQKLAKLEGGLYLRSPMAGVVTKSTLALGMPASGEVCVVSDPDHLHVLVSVREVDIGSVKLKQPATIKTEATGDTKIQGEVSYVSSIANQDSTGTTNVKFNVRIKITQEELSALRIGMNARVEIVLNQKTDVFSVPYDSLVTVDGKDYLYIVQDGTVKRVAVTLGMETGTRVEVMGEGLATGLQVIANPDGVKAGQKVTVGGQQ